MAKNKKGVMFPKLLMLVGALSLMGYAIAWGVTKRPIEGIIYNFKSQWPLLLIIGFIFVFIPFSVKTGTWTLLWGLLITTLSIVLLVVGSLITKVDLKSFWTYLSIAPLIMLALGSFLWTITAYMK